jgi:hypothetical protein
LEIHPAAGTFALQVALLKGCNVKIKIPKKVREQCEQFAIECASTNKDEYAKRNQTNLSKIQLDIVVGKIGEWAVMKFLGKGCSKPDFEIYTAKKKSFDADLTYNGVNVHVKSQSEKSASMYGISWLFQKRDPLYRKPNPDDLIVGVLVGDTEAEIVMYGNVASLVFGEPKIHQLRGSKVAIYLEENEELKYVHRG